MMIAGIKIEKIKGCSLPIVMDFFSVMDGPFDSPIPEELTRWLRFLDIQKRELVHQSLILRRLKINNPRFAPMKRPIIKLNASMIYLLEKGRWS
jgi:hypothetical protein